VRILAIKLALDLAAKDELCMARPLCPARRHRDVLSVIRSEQRPLAVQTADCVHHRPPPPEASFYDPICHTGRAFHSRRRTGASVIRLAIARPDST
jgi:hypothetical protein